MKIQLADVTPKGQRCGSVFIHQQSESVHDHTLSEEGFFIIVLAAGGL